MGGTVTAAVLKEFEKENCAAETRAGGAEYY
jgi:hypothetical protein